MRKGEFKDEYDKSILVVYDSSISNRYCNTDSIKGKGSTSLL